MIYIFPISGYKFKEKSGLYISQDASFSM